VCDGQHGSHDGDVSQDRLPPAGLFLGSALMGVLYDVSLPALIAFSVAAQLASIPLFFWVGKRASLASHA